MRLLSIFVIFLILLPIFVESDGIFSSIFSFGKKKPNSTPAPKFGKSSAGSRCNMATNQCSAYECCNSDQTCLRNRCFPRLSNCPVTRDQCGTSCCKTSEQCRNGVCSR